MGSVTITRKEAKSIAYADAMKLPAVGEQVRLKTGALLRHTEKHINGTQWCLISKKGDRSDIADYEAIAIRVRRAVARAETKKKMAQTK